MLRTNYRKERVYLYHLEVPKRKVRALLNDYLLTMNNLVETPEFYDALANNCTTAIKIHVDAIRLDEPPPFDWRIIASGHVDGLLYDRGKLITTMPFKELRRISRVDLRMQKERREDFSNKVREHLRSALEG